MDNAKRFYFEHALENYPEVHVWFLDDPALVIPKIVRTRCALGSDLFVSFIYGYNLPVPIPDLRIEDAGIRATLSIDRTPEMTFVPWSAVVAIAVPDVVQVAFARSAKEQPGTVQPRGLKVKSTGSAARGKLKLVS